MSGPYQGHALVIYTISSMKEFKFSLNFLQGQLEITLWYQMIRTIVGPYSSHIGAKLSSNVRAIFRPFHVIVDNFHYIGCSSEAASGNMVKFSKVHASRISWSEKISRYNRKRVSRAHHTKCMHHIGCSSKAASGNVVKYNIDGVLQTLTITN